MSVSIVATPIINGISVTGSATTITASTVALGAASAAAMSVTPTGDLTATNVQAALEALSVARDIKSFQQNTAPTGSTLTEGDTWYDLDDNEFKVYRETSTGVFQWVPIIVGAAGDTSDILDAGAF